MEDCCQPSWGVRGGVAARRIVTFCTCISMRSDFRFFQGTFRRSVPARASNVTRHTSHVTRHTSHATSYTLHVTRHTSPMLPSTRRRGLPSAMQADGFSCADNVRKAPPHPLPPPRHKTKPETPTKKNSPRHNDFPSTSNLSNLQLVQHNIAAPYADVQILPVESLDE